MEQNQQHNDLQKSHPAHTRFRIRTWRVAVVIIVLAIGINFYIPARRRAMEKSVKANVSFIEFVLDCWSDDHDGRCPLKLEAIIDDGYINELPINPFTGRPTRVIAFRDKPFEGEISYTPILADGKFWHYEIIAYGSAQTPGEDTDGDGVPDHVIYRGEAGELLGSEEYYARMNPDHRNPYLK
jgi:hypothetical protein